MTPRCRTVSLLCTLFLLLPPLPPPSPCFPGSLRQLLVTILHLGASLDVSVGKESTCSAGDPGSIPGSRRSRLPCRVLARVTDVCLAHSKGSINERIHSFTHSFIHSRIQYLLRIGYPLQYSWASLVAQLVKNPPAMQETQLQSLGWEDPLEKGKAIHYSILDWRIPCTIWGCKESDTTE